MDHHPQNHIAQAVDALAATGAHTPQNLSADELVIALSDLATIARLLGQLVTQTRRQLAAWATVGAQLPEARVRHVRFQQFAAHCGLKLVTLIAVVGAQCQASRCARAGPERGRM